MQEFAESDQRMLSNLYPVGTEFRWYGSSRDVGQGPDNRLVHAIKSSRVHKVYIQTKHNGHNGTAKVMSACRTHDVPFQMVRQRERKGGLEF